MKTVTRYEDITRHQCLIFYYQGYFKCWYIEDTPNGVINDQEKQRILTFNKPEPANDNKQLTNNKKLLREADKESPS